MQPTRFSVDGMRFYTTDKADKAYPSVTTVLGRTASEHSQKALNSWNERNPGGREAAAERGSIIHAAVEDYIRGRPVNVPTELKCYWEGLPRHLDRYDGFIWSERPLLPEHLFCVGSDDISRVWSHRYGYCGCPDLIAFRRGVYILPDLKSSNGPYCRYFPKEDNRKHFGGHMKYAKCAMQLAAYRIAVKETLGVHLDELEILVTYPEGTQSFRIHGPELKRYEFKWLQKVRKFYDMQKAQQELELGAAVA